MKKAVEQLSTQYKDYDIEYINDFIFIYIVSNIKRRSRSLTDRYWQNPNEAVRIALDKVRSNIKKHIEWCEYATKYNLS